MEFNKAAADYAESNFTEKWLTKRDLYEAFLAGCVYADKKAEEQVEDFIANALPASQKDIDLASLLLI